LGHSVFDEEGKETAIKITKDSNSEAGEILGDLVDIQVFGTIGVKTMKVRCGSRALFS
jgi:hypothetical protein